MKERTITLDTFIIAYGSKLYVQDDHSLVKFRRDGQTFGHVLSEVDANDSLVPDRKTGFRRSFYRCLRLPCKIYFILSTVFAQLT